MMFLLLQHLSTSKLGIYFWQSVKEIVCACFSDHWKAGPDHMSNSHLDPGLVICGCWEKDEGKSGLTPDTHCYRLSLMCQRLSGEL